MEDVIVIVDNDNKPVGNLPHALIHKCPIHQALLDLPHSHSIYGDYLFKGEQKDARARRLEQDSYGQNKRKG